jgi:nicotinamidase-related amidase
LIGTEGHAVVSVLNDALQEWSANKMKMIHYIHKGMNCLTEMYSAIKAEVPVSDDPSTELNRTLLSELRQADKLIFCGEAKSHCVNYTMRDVAAHWEKEMSSLYLLNDCTSAVPGFEEAANSFVQDMKDLGCQVVLHQEMTLIL